MGRSHLDLPLQSTLGFFVQGVPVVFVQAEIALGSDRKMQAYLDFYRRCEEGGVHDPPLTLDLCQAYESFVTLLHEVRHFHDALLCRPLFEMFVSHTQVSLCVVQLASKLPSGTGHIPVDWRDPRIAGTPEIKLLKETIFNDDELYFTRFSSLWDMCALDAFEIDLFYLLEASAMLAEFLYLYVVHGIRSTEDYYSYVVLQKSDAKYTLLIDLFKRLHGNLIDALQALYVALAYSLFSSDAPAQTFCDLVQDTKSDPKAIFTLCNPNTLQHAFRDEAALADRIRRTVPIGRQGVVRVNSENNSNSVSELLNLNQTMYACRERLITTYVQRFGYRADLYFEHLYELPIPPVLFFPELASPDDQLVKGVPEDEFRRHKAPLFVIAARTRENLDKLVIAGLTTIPGTKPPFSLELADMQLCNEYFYKCLFEGKTSVYAPIVDHMYKNVLLTMPAFASHGTRTRE